MSNFSQLMSRVLLVPTRNQVIYGFAGLGAACWLLEKFVPFADLPDDAPILKTLVALMAPILGGLGISLAIPAFRALFITKVGRELDFRVMVNLAISLFLLILLLAWYYLTL